MRIFTLALLASVLFVGCQESEPTMITSDTGTRYLLFDDGEGDQVVPGEFVYFHASMRTEGDSTLFSTRDGGGDMPVVQAAPLDQEQVGPVEDVIRYMRVGDRAQVRVNIEEFPNKPPGLETDTVVLYDVEVMEILSEEEFGVRQEAKQAEEEAARAEVQALAPERLQFAEEVRAEYKEGGLEDVQTTPSGLKYVVHEAGTGAQAAAGSGVTVQYIGMLVENGNVFDQSFERGSGIPFRLGSGQVIPGWDEGIALLKEGAKATMFIPAELGYGAQGTPDGSIPPDSELAFYIELEKVD